jgi:intracellular multiplication protein IcmL
MAAPTPKEPVKTEKEQQALPQNVDSTFHDPLMLRQNFYRDNYRVLMYFTYFLIIISIALMAYTFYERTHKPKVNYYATTNDGKLIKLSPLDEPNLSTKSLLDWVEEAAITAYNFNFNNYEDVIKNMRVYFTEPGYDNFVSALTSKKIIDEVVSKRLVVFAVPSGNPVILKEGPTSEGIYAWQVQLPILVTYQSAASQKKQRLVLTLIVSRRPTLESPKAIGIASFIVREV